MPAKGAQRVAVEEFAFQGCRCGAKESEDANAGAFLCGKLMAFRNNLFQLPKQGFYLSGVNVFLYLYRTVDQLNGRVCCTCVQVGQYLQPIVVKALIAKGYEIRVAAEVLIEQHHGLVAGDCLQPVIQQGTRAIVEVDRCGLDLMFRGEAALLVLGNEREVPQLLGIAYDYRPTGPLQAR